MNPLSSHLGRSSGVFSTLSKILALTPEEREINTMLIEKNIKWLCHFTPRENLNKIRRDGLKIRSDLDFDAVVTDQGRYDRYNRRAPLS